MHEILATAMFLGARKDRGVRFYLTWHLKVKTRIFQVKSKYQFAKICVFWVTNFKFWLQLCFFEPIKLIQNVKIGQIWPCYFNELKKCSWSQNLISLSQKTKIWWHNPLSRSFGKYSFYYLMTAQRLPGKREKHLKIFRFWPLHNYNISLL